MTGKAQAGLWGAAAAYERYMGRWSRKVAPLFLEWLDPPAAKSWVDIGCGTGELSLAIADRCAPGRLLGIDSSLPFLAVARQRVPLASFVRGDALRLALPDGEFDHAVSGLVLNFLPDAARALAEMARVTRPGGTVALYVWDYAGQMQVMRHFFDAARLVDPASAAHDDGLRSPICRPAPLRDAFLAAGLAAPETVALDIPAAFVDFEDYWSPFLGGTGSAPKYCAGLDETTRARVRDLVRQRLPTGPEGEILLAIRAWGVRGRVPG